MLQYMHTPFACNAFYTPCMHSLTSQTVQLINDYMGWSSRPDYLIHGWWCQCVCATDWGQVHSTACYRFEPRYSILRLGGIEYLWFESW